ncbi:site-specific integrase [Flavobacterium sp. UBA6046]|jgi:integrase|uniref:site-specific integrase n=1 Tax=Flavobacterium sp. UBA6046 TaxID=1946552 RepID=UPI0025BEA6C5|nr:site-specific integrase [Flavobacterium sp. UBA6046]
MAGFKFTVKFVLQQTKDKSKPTPLRCFVRYNNTRSVFSSGVSIEPKYWNAEKQEPRLTASLQNADDLLKDIKNVKKWIGLAFDVITKEKKEYPDPDKLKEYCLLFIKNDGIDPNAEKPKTKFTLFEYIELLISNTKNGKRVLGTGERFSPGTIKAYGSAFGILKKYQQFKYKRPLEFEDIDLEFYEDFKDWSYNIEGLSNNYFGAVIKFLKLCLNEAKESELHKNEKYNSKNFVKVKSDVENIYLNQTQLELLANHDFSKNPKLERVRDLFLVGCYTGLRFSDFINIQPKNIQGNFIEIKTIKTGQTVAIPIHSIIRDIMKRYEGKTPNSLPPAISNVKLNAYIKDVAEDAGLKEVITLEKAIAGKKVIVNKPLFELITTHCARRSFASNMFHLGVPTSIIMAVTGHRTEAAFNLYIKVTPKEKAEMMLAIWNRNNMQIANSGIAVTV